MHQSRRVPVIGIVGGIGSGKSAVANWVAERHPVLVIDADRIGHQVLEEDAVRGKLRDAFGPDIFDDAGRVVRRELGRIVFGPTADHLAARARLEAIVHPEIRREIESQIAAVDPRRHRAALLDAAVMLETGWVNACDVVVFIDTPETQRRERVANRGWTPDDLARRETSQWPLDRKRRAANVVIANEADLPTAGEALWAVVQTEIDSTESSGRRSDNSKNPPA